MRVYKSTIQIFTNLQINELAIIKFSKREISKGINTMKQIIITSFLLILVACQSNSPSRVNNENEVSLSSSIEAVSSSSEVERVVLNQNIQYEKMIYMGNEYRTVQIGNQQWMAENMRFRPTTGNSYCPNEEELNCDVYGRLYTFEIAGTICPEGWHVSTNDDWNTLVAFLGYDAGIVANKLKANSNLWASYSGTDEVGFTALPAGFRSENPYNGSNFLFEGYYAMWWTSTSDETDNDYAYSWSLYYKNGNTLKNEVDSKNSAYSIRCVNDL